MYHAVRKEPLVVKLGKQGSSCFAYCGVAQPKQIRGRELPTYTNTKIVIDGDGGNLQGANAINGQHES